MSNHSSATSPATSKRERLDSFFSRRSSAISAGIHKLTFPCLPIKSHPAKRLSYTPLADQSNEIRLLQILGRKWGRNIVKCSLSTFPIDQAPPYSALSYTWGPAEGDRDRALPSPPKRILVGDELHDVTENLHDALQEFARRAKASSPAPQNPTYIWIDAICIDQSNMEERGQQVGIMDQIYSKAQKVIVWLGKDGQQSGPTVTDFLVKLNRVDGSLPVQNPMEHLSQNLVEILAQHELPDIEHTSWLVLLSFFRLNWFSRVWVVQEVALARDIEVLYGCSTIGWTELGIASHVIKSGLEMTIVQQHMGELEEVGTGQKMLSVNLRMIFSIRRWCAEGGIPTNLTLLYSIFTGREAYDSLYAPATLSYVTSRYSAADPRDKVFAILGIIKILTSSSTPLSVVDYTKTAGQVYTDAMSEILRSSQWLGSLCTVNPARKDDGLSLPSWVPDFQPTMCGILAAHLFNETTSLCSTSVLSVPDLAIKGKHLTFTASKIAEIQATSEPLGPVFSGDGDFEDGLALLLDLPDVCPFTKQTRLEVLWRTLIQDNLRTNTSSEMQDFFEKFWIRLWLSRAFSTELEPAEYLQTVPLVDTFAKTTGLAGHDMILAAREDTELENILRYIMEGSIPSNRFTAAVSDVFDHRCLFSTCENHLGIGSEAVRPGDEIWISPRAPVPFVLRKVAGEGEEGNRYTFVGESYVHGTMPAEYFADNAEPLWEEVVLQ